MNSSIWIIVVVALIGMFSAHRGGYERGYKKGKMEVKQHKKFTIKPCYTEMPVERIIQIAEDGSVIQIFFIGTDPIVVNLSHVTMTVEIAVNA